MLNQPATPAASDQPTAAATDPAASPALPATPPTQAGAPANAIPNATPTEPNSDPFSPAVLQDLAVPEPTPVAGSRRKELTQPLPETATAEAPPESPSTQESLAVASPELPSSGSAEVEPQKELGPEIEKAMERIEQHKVTSTKETAVRAEQLPSTQPKTTSQPVVVLPLTEADMNQGKNKNTSYSVRWLYEWSVRQIKKFADTLVVYRE